MDLHVVWDWNGTLLDDLDVVVAAVNVSLAAMDAPAIDADGYRDHYTRPVWLFYERLLGRRIAPREWAHIDDVFHRTYRATLDALAWSRTLVPRSTPSSRWAAPSRSFRCGGTTSSCQPHDGSPWIAT